LRRVRPILVRDALDVLAAVTLELSLDPIDGVAISLRALSPISELGKTFDRGFVLLEVEPADERADGVIRRILDGVSLRVRASAGQRHQSTDRGEK
jgi:hypothetical protein